MVREAFKETRFRGAALNLIQTCDVIITDYQKQGLRLTLRQLYYQLVSRNVVENTERSYKNVGNLISKARLSGYLDWDAIEDRVRVPDIPSEWEDIADLVNGACRAYRLPRWRDQENYVELWVEKDALSGVLAPLAFKYHVTLMVNRGYSSQSAMYEAGKRFLRAENPDGDVVNEEGEVMGHRNLHLLYLGDHDPSGEDMVRDVRERLAMFGADVDVEKIALTTAQVRQYNPPPNPAKITDSRAAAYIAKHGRSSWEVDALPPEVLTALIEKAILKRLDTDKYKAHIAREETQKQGLRDAASKIK